MRVKGAPPFLPWVVAIWITWTVAAAAGKVAQTDPVFIFTQATYNGSILENTFGKKYIHTQRRMGIQLQGRFSTLDVEYTIIDGDQRNVFKAEAVTVEDFCFLRIRTRTDGFGRLNREFSPTFYLKIKATGVSPARQNIQETFTDVIIEVKDENEFNPLFSSPQSTVSIPEDTPLHTSIAQVQASDADIGRNGEIYYSFKQATLVFAIHPTTGVVSLTRPVPYDRRREFKLNVLARDRGITPSGRSSSSSQSDLIINILPVNYHAPSIRVHSHQTLVEHGSLDSVFAVLTITDPDHDHNGKIGGVRIINDEENVFRLEPQNTKGMYNILVKKPVDRETMPVNYNITVIASDKGAPPKTATVTIPIRVQDVNDNEPVFEYSFYNVTVSEIVLPNTPVVFVKALDKDVGSNGEVRYSIVDGNDGDLFNIDPASGLIKTAARLDSELARQVTLVLQAQDQATSGTRQTGQCRVIVNIEDYNDNTPLITMDSDVVMVRENLPKGSRVTRITAHDDDSGDNGKLSYSIINYNSVPFDIDAFTGEITTTAVLDYETMRRKYELHVRVADWGSPFRREQDMSLTINVEDLNDNSPEFEEIRCSGYLSRQSPLRMDVVKLTALDFDSGNTVTYSITDGNGDDCFSIVPSSGSVTVNCDMSGYRDGTRTLTVVASDGQHVSIPVTITLTLVNNKQNQHLASDNVRIKCDRRDVMRRFEAQTHASHEANVRLDRLNVVSGSMKTNTSPVVDKAFSTYAEVSESAKIGTEVLDFGRFVSDPDSGYDGQLTYVISADGDAQGAFKLDSFTGKLLVMSKLDNEKKSVYSLTLTASDLGQAPLSVSRKVKIVIKDENDNVPEFDKALYDVEVSEDAIVNSVLLKIRATDLDTGNNARVRYSIRSDDRDFSIDPDKGTITVRRKLDRETSSNQELVIQAEDSGATTRLSSTAIVNITITDINDNDPLFLREVYTVRVREDLPIGAVITTLTAHDIDAGANGQITYRFAEGLPQNFEIDSLTGSIRIRRQLDYETTQVHNLTGLAEDSGQPPRSGSCKLIIEVMDVDENAHGPEFPDFLERSSVAEGSPIGTYVKRVQAQDKDNPEFGAGQITYSLEGGSGLGRFTMDSIVFSKIKGQRTSFFHSNQD
ncbi:fat cadherin [Elysia marginata]|uniref:Fat cadherin n=1 Tax=Elysia marginata TaxID=1093978 RepID=A0AAV4HHC4_9GAST|nr:fat cadherin [Elysia marginata]